MNNLQARCCKYDNEKNNIPTCRQVRGAIVQSLFLFMNDSSK